MLLRLASLAGFTLVASLPAAELPRSPAAKKAADAYAAELAKLEENYRKELKQLNEKYQTDLDAARKAALEKNDLDEAQRVLELKKSLGADPREELVAQRRRKLADSTWQWLGPDGLSEKLTLNADGTVRGSWMTKEESGRWYVNPDLTVTWWSTGFGCANIMKLNAALTEHTAHVPKMDLPRWGKRLK